LRPGQLAKYIKMEFYIVDYSTKQLYTGSINDCFEISFVKHPHQKELPDEEADWVVNTGCGEQFFPEIPWNTFQTGTIEI
jgi:hypothetical protein